MKTNTAGSKGLSMILMAAGAIMTIAALALDFMGNKASFRGPLLVIGVLAFVLGVYLFPTLKHHRKIVYVIFLFPLLFTFVVTVIIPLVLGIFYSMTDWTGIQFTKFVGLANYAAMFKDPAFIWSVLMTFVFVVINMVLVNLVAFLLALLCTSGLKGDGFFRAAYFLPNLIGGIVLGYVWKFVFNRAFVAIGSAIARGNVPSLLSTTGGAMFCLVLVSVWQFAGYMMLIYVAGFMSVSDALKEAAMIDGCTPTQAMFNVTIPLMRASFVQCIFLSITRCFVIYDVNLSLTKGEPFNTSVMAAMHVYNTAFTYKKYGLGQAEALILFAVCAIVGVTQVYIGKKGEVAA